MSNNNSHRRAVSVAALSFIVGIASAGEIRVACYSDGNECEVTQDLAKRFEAQNADVKVAIDKVPYKAIVEQLPVQLDVVFDHTLERKVLEGVPPAC